MPASTTFDFKSLSMALDISTGILCGICLDTSIYDRVEVHPRILQNFQPCTNTRYHLLKCGSLVRTETPELCSSKCLGRVIRDPGVTESGFWCDDCCSREIHESRQALIEHARKTYAIPSTMSDDILEEEMEKAGMLEDSTEVVLASIKKHREAFAVEDPMSKTREQIAREDHAEAARLGI